MFPAPKALVGEMYQNSSKTARRICPDGNIGERAAISGGVGGKRRWLV